ncbi:MAG TPA: GNAT family N-acetyltransferase, partial [Candidatus Ozemobacteraceae bacterium]|nr:GNAT family N-acetyltransferase [Candidatus Ozemobacteraceae bacterium]
MLFRVMGSAAEWDAHLSGFSDILRDIYFSFEWHSLFSIGTSARPVAIFCEGKNGARLFYPFLLWPVPGCLSGIPAFVCESAYGYGGPIAENFVPDDLAEAEQAFCEWARTNNVIAEFVRFHPLLGNHRWFRREISIEENRQTVPVPLDSPFELLWERFTPAKRRNIRKADKAGMIVRQGDDFTGFWRLYEMTMNRRSAAGFYYFSPEHRRELEQLVSNHGFLLEARLDGRLAASAIYLRSAHVLHYHLGASDAEFLPFFPNDRLMAEAVKLGRESGLKILHLGGGATTAADDSLLR